MKNKSQALQYLHIARSTFYYSSLLDPKDSVLREKIEGVLDKHPSYGHKRIALELGMNKKPIRRVMKKFGLKPRRGRKKSWKRAVDWESVSSPNLLISLFPLYKNHVWVTDFTYLWWRGRWVYVCTILDLFSRDVLGISIKTNHSALLVSEALLNALATHPAPAITHSDQGSEYRSRLFRSILTDFNITQSMSKKGSPWQNGYQESFYGNWKVDIGDVNRFSSLGELTAEIYKSMYYYNNERIHTALRMAPKEFARQNEIKYHTNQEILGV
jgi:transposase InsO family protein